MSARAYYNEVDAYAAEWIRNLIAAGLITAGDVDTRSVVDVQPSDLRGYTRCHFFAGIAVWDYALGLAGWPADRPVWTGSCPCQPFSSAGRRAGTADERHLWPAWFHLISECRPATVLGEQVASADGLGWLDLVHADLDGAGYAFGAADLCAAGVGAPHIRQRLWFVADAASERRDGPELAGATGAQTAGCAEAEGRWTAGLREPAGCGAAGGVGDPICTRGRRYTRAIPGSQGEGAGEGSRARCQPDQPIVAGEAGGVGHTSGFGCQRRQSVQEPTTRCVDVGTSAAGGFWSSCDWIPCRDGKARPVEPGTFPLAHGAPARMGRLRAYGNAINAEAATAFIAACLDVLPTDEVAA